MKGAGKNMAMGQAPQPIQQMVGQAKTDMVERAAEAAKIAVQSGAQPPQWGEIDFDFSQECCIACVAPCVQVQKNFKDQNLGDGQMEFAISAILQAFKYAAMALGALFLGPVMGGLLYCAAWAFFTLALGFNRKKTMTKFSLPDFKPDDYVCLCFCSCFTLLQEEKTVNQVVEQYGVQAMIGDPIQAMVGKGKGLATQIGSNINNAAAKIGLGPKPQQKGQGKQQMQYQQPDPYSQGKGYPQQGYPQQGYAGGKPAGPPVAAPPPGSVVMMPDGKGGHAPMMVQQDGSLAPANNQSYNQSNQSYQKY